MQDTQLNIGGAAVVISPARNVQILKMLVKYIHLCRSSCCSCYCCRRRPNGHRKGVLSPVGLSLFRDSRLYCSVLSVNWQSVCNTSKTLLIHLLGAFYHPV